MAGLATVDGTSVGFPLAFWPLTHRVTVVPFPRTAFPPWAAIAVRDVAREFTWRVTAATPPATNDRAPLVRAAGARLSRLVLPSPGRVRTGGSDTQSFFFFFFFWREAGWPCGSYRLRL